VARPRYETSEGCAGLADAEPHTHRGRSMQGTSRVFVGLDTSKLKISVALAEEGPLGEVRFLGDIDNTPDALARRIGDLRLALAAMVAGDVRDPWWVPVPLAGQPPAPPVRVALVDADRRPGLDPGIGNALEQAAKWLQDADYVVEKVAPPSLEEAAHLWSTLVLNKAKVGMISQINQYGSAAIRKTGALMIEQAPPTDFPSFLRALGRRATVLREWQLFFERYPLILLPVAREPARQ
jgi:Asp-tRNA(Asn)/Glu-tRNA(Gln) amidotransferase A subunit family amidase